MKHTIYIGNTLEVLKTLPDESVDCIVTSPPYWGLRDYGIEGQIGLEPTLEEYLEKLLKITAELKRVLKKTGVMFWNHGDSYSTGSHRDYVPSTDTIPTKSLCLQNYRLVLRMIDEQSWILRNVIIWHKPNHMPSSVKDRFTNAYEPIFMLVKNKKYWFDLDAVRVPSKTGNGASQGVAKGKRFGGYSQATTPVSGFGERELKNHPLGKNPGDLWTIPTQPFPEAHFATYPEKLVEPMIKAGCPSMICKKCGFIRERITEKGNIICKGGASKHDIAIKRHKIRKNIVQREIYTLGWTDCGCNAGWKAGVVLDPFAGSGTTMIVAEKLGRNSIGIELNPDYVEIIKKRFKPYFAQAKLNGKTELKIIDMR